MARTAILLLVVLTSGAGPALADPPHPATTLPETAQRFVAWWDALGYPDVGSLPFVRWLPGERSRWTHVPETAFWDHGFLVREDARTFTVFSTDLRTRTWTRTAPGTPIAHAVAAEPTDLLGWAEAGVAALEAWKGEGTPRGDPFGFDRSYGHRARFRTLVVARACLARGGVDLARRLFGCAERWAKNARAESPAERPAAWQEWIAASGLLAAGERVGDPGASWNDVRAEFSRWARAHPQAGHRARAAADVATLDRQIAEEKARAERPQPAWDGLTEEQKIDAWMAALRDPGGAVLSWRGWRGADGREPSAAERLAAIGIPAVPRLFAALSDASFTRTTTDVQGRFTTTLVPVRVQDVAESLLGEISAEAWREDALLPRGKTVIGTPGFEYRIRAWWAAVRARGEATVLDEVVSRGGDAAGFAAERLGALDPVRALAAIERGLQNAHRPFAREALVHQAGRLRGQEVLSLLRREATQGETLGARVRAASELSSRGDPAGIAALVAEWGRPRSPPAEGAMGPRDMEDAMARHALLDALVASGAAVAYRTLAAGLAERPVADRLAVVLSFAPAGARMASAMGGGAFLGPSANAPRLPLAPEAVAALEALIGGRLDDRETVPRLSVSVGDVDPGAQVGHAAAWALATWLPDAYGYDPLAPSADREAMRARCFETWRRRSSTPESETPR